MCIHVYVMLHLMTTEARYSQSWSPSCPERVFVSFDTYSVTLLRARAQPPKTWTEHPDWNKNHGPGICTCCDEEFSEVGSHAGSRHSRRSRTQRSHASE